jgi:bacterioferritin
MKAVPLQPEMNRRRQGMIGNEQLVAVLNELLADELTAINQYMVHSEMCANWRYDKLHEKAEKRAIDEMKHAEKLIERILFLGGTPIVTNLKAIHIGSNVEAMHQNDMDAEADASRAYNEGIRLAVEVGDNGTREMLESILKDEEEHLDWLDAQLAQIQQMSLPIYLTEQID